MGVWKKVIAYINWINSCRRLSFTVLQGEEPGWLLLIQCAFWHEEDQTNSMGITCKGSSVHRNGRHCTHRSLLSFNLAWRTISLWWLISPRQSLDKWSTRAFSSFLHLAEWLQFLSQIVKASSFPQVLCWSLQVLWWEDHLDVPSKTLWSSLQTRTATVTLITLPLLSQNESLIFLLSFPAEKKGLTSILFHSDSNQSWL